MSASTRVATVAEMQGRDLLRRRLALIILVALPLAFYLATFASSEGSSEAADEWWAVGAGALGMAWSVAGATLFAVLAARRVDPRLVRAGFRPWELLLGRLLLLESFAAVLLAGFYALILVLSGPESPAMLALALALEAIVAVPLGLAVATLLPRELEGTLAIIGIVGIEMSLPTTSGLAFILPLYGPVKLIEVALGSAEAVAPAVVHALLYAGGLFLIAAVLWTRRVQSRALTQMGHAGSPAVRPSP